MKTRPITMDDIAPCIHLGEEMHEHSVLKDWPIDREKAAFMLEHLLSLPESVFCWGHFDDLDPVAVLVGGIQEHMFCDVKIASDLVFYGRRDNAGARGAIALLHAFEAWAKAKGAGLVFIEVSAGITDDRTTRLLKRLGYEQTGTGMRKAA